MAKLRESVYKGPGQGVHIFEVEEGDNMIVA